MTGAGQTGFLACTPFGTLGISPDISREDFVSIEEGTAENEIVAEPCATASSYCAALPLGNAAAMSSSVAMSAVGRFENRDSRVDVPLAGGESTTPVQALSPQFEEVIAFMMRLFRRRQPIDQTNAQVFRLLTSKREALAARYNDVTEKQKTQWMNEKLRRMADALGSMQMYGFLADGLHLNEDGRRFAVEHLDVIREELCFRDVVECILLFPHEATNDDLVILFGLVERHLRAQGKYDFDHYSREEIVHKLAKITGAFLGYVSCECRAIESVYRNGAFSERSSTIFETNARKVKLRLSAKGRQEKHRHSQEIAELRRRGTSTPGATWIRDWSDDDEDEAPPPDDGDTISMLKRTARASGQSALFDDPRVARGRKVEREEAVAETVSESAAPAPTAGEKLPRNDQAQSGAVEGPSAKAAGGKNTPAFPFTTNELRAQVADVGARKIGVLYPMHYGDAATDWVTREAMAVISASNDVTAYYRDGKFTDVLRDLLLSFLRQRGPRRSK